MLTRFLDEHEGSLTDGDVAGLDRLLDLSDNELLDLILARTEPDADLAPEALRVLARLRVADARPDQDDRPDHPNRPDPLLPHDCTGRAMNSTKKATLSFSDGSPSIDFPIYEGTVGPEVIDIRKLYGQTGKFTFDPGFMSTAACDSKITYIDGDKGELLYRGYPIEQLAQHCDYLETCHLLLYGELPNRAQQKDFEFRVTRHTMVHEQMTRFFQGFRRDAHPMAILVGCVGALSAFYHDSLDINDPEHRRISAIRLIAKMPTLVAMAYKYSNGQPFMYPQNKLSYSANFMRMMFGTPCEDYEVNDVLVRARSTGS